MKNTTVLLCTTIVVFDLDNTLLYCPEEGKTGNVRRGAIELLSALAMTERVIIVLWTRAKRKYAVEMLYRSGLVQYFDIENRLFEYKDCKRSKKIYGCYKASYYVCDKLNVDCRYVRTILVDDVPRNGLCSAYDIVIWILPFSGHLPPVMHDEETRIVQDRWVVWQQAVEEQNIEKARKIQTYLGKAALREWGSYSTKAVICLPTLVLVYMYLSRSLCLPSPPTLCRHIKMYHGLIKNI